MTDTLYDNRISRLDALREVAKSRTIGIQPRPLGGFMVEFCDPDGSVAEWGAGRTRSIAMSYALGAFYE